MVLFVVIVVLAILLPLQCPYIVSGAAATHMRATTFCPGDQLPVYCTQKCAVQFELEEVECVDIRSSALIGDLSVKKESPPMRWTLGSEWTFVGICPQPSRDADTTSAPTVSETTPAPTTDPTPAPTTTTPDRTTHPTSAPTTTTPDPPDPTSAPTTTPTPDPTTHLTSAPTATTVSLTGSPTTSACPKIGWTIAPLIENDSDLLSTEKRVFISIDKTKVRHAVVILVQNHSAVDDGDVKVFYQTGGQLLPWSPSSGTEGDASKISHDEFYIPFENTLSAVVVLPKNDANVSVWVAPYPTLQSWSKTSEKTTGRAFFELSSPVAGALRVLQWRSSTVVQLHLNSSTSVPDSTITAPSEQLVTAEYVTIGVHVSLEGESIIAGLFSDRLPEYSVEVVGGWASLKDEQFHPEELINVFQVPSLGPIAWMFFRIADFPRDTLFRLDHSDPPEGSELRFRASFGGVPRLLSGGSVATWGNHAVGFSSSNETMWVAVYNKADTSPAGNFSLRVLGTPALMSAVGDSELLLPQHSSVYTIVDASVYESTLLFLAGWEQDDAFAYIAAKTVSIRYIQGVDSWPSMGCKNVNDGSIAVVDNTAHINFPRGVFHFVFCNSLDSPLVLKYRLSQGGPDTGNWSTTSNGMGGDDALAIILGLVVVAIIFTALAITITKPSPADGFGELIVD